MLDTPTKSVSSKNAELLEQKLLKLSDLQGSYAASIIRPLFEKGSLVTPKCGRDPRAGEPHIVLEMRSTGLHDHAGDGFYRRIDMRVAHTSPNGGQLHDYWTESFNFEPWKAPEADG